MKTSLNSRKRKPGTDGTLLAIAAQIHPLPENVVPSERFLEQMRKRLLDLDREYNTGYRAA